MANKIKGEVELEHEGKTYALVLDFNALAEFEAEADVENALVVLAKPNALGASRMRALFWAGLKQRHPEITRQEAGRLLSGHLDKLGEALAAAFPAAEAHPGNAPALAPPRQR